MLSNLEGSGRTSKDKGTSVEKDAGCAFQGAHCFESLSSL